MGLKQSIVIVNEYTTKTGTKGGTRGGSPGDYVMRYMARKGATEDLTPIRRDDNDAYITRYMARKEATETLDSIKELKREINEVQGYGGVAFGNDDISMSHVKVKAVSRDIQKQFDNGKTVLKTVVSFDEEYLREHGIIEEDFTCRHEGDYRGNIDQLKLRRAVTAGMDKMSRHYDDLQWIGVIQVDTKHVHCHLCMVDKGDGMIMSDGKQRGKIPEKFKRDFRRGVDMQLDATAPVRMMASNITHDRRNARCFIKKYAHTTLAEYGTPQFLLACLPKDRTLWRAGTNRKEMRQANQIVREYVNQVLEEPDSGYREAMLEIDNYAQHRQRQEGLSDKDYRRMVNNGRERLVEDCMNGVYSVLRQIPDSEYKVRTPMMDVMSMDYTDMAAEASTDPMIEFGFRLRSYSSRLDHHKKERHKYHDSVQAYESAQERNEVSPASKALYDFYLFEEEYNAKLMCKYQYFLSFLPPGEEYQNDFRALIDYKNKMRNLQAMMDDRDMRRMKADNAEDYGRRVYEMHGGHFAVTAPQILQSRYSAMENTYDKMKSDFIYKLSDYGLSLETADTGNMKVSFEKPYGFDAVKALDLHHLGYDFPYDAPVSMINVNEFVKTANERYNLYQGAKRYLIGSDQTAVLEGMPEKDITVMKEMADRFVVNPVIKSAVGTASGKRHNGATVRLETDYTKDMQLAVKTTVQSLSLGE